jgi:hypothetical protein
MQHAQNHIAMESGSGEADHSSLPTPVNKFAFSVAEFGSVSGLSRSLLYEVLRLGELKSVKVRGRRLILAEDGLAWLRSYRRPV